MDFVAFHRKAKCYFLGVANPAWVRKQYADDFAQYAVMTTLTRCATLRQMYCDFMRETFGDMRNPSGKAKALDRLHPTPTTYDGFAAPELTVYRDEDEAFLALVDKLKLKKEERAYLVLRFQKNYTLQEIAQCFGVTESAVCLRLQTILERNKIRLKRHLTE